MQWVDKYAPSSMKEIKGQENAVERINSFIKNFKKGTALLVWGPTGCGKTCAAYALANDLGYELAEMNASELRNKDAVKSFLGSVTGQMSLFAKGKIVLVDEVDLFSGTYDRGGIPALVQIIQNSPYPVVCTANDPFHKKLKLIRKISSMIEFSELHHSIIFDELKRITKEEGLSLNNTVLKTLARKSAGDLRGAIHDLQAISFSANSNPEEFLASERRRTESMEQALLKVLKSKDPEIFRGAFNNVQEDLDSIFLWVDYNMSKEYSKPEDLKKGFDSLALADVFKGRIRRQQYYRYYVYCFELLTSGIALAKKERYPGMTQYKQSLRLLRMWQANMKHAKRKMIAEKLSQKTHQSARQAFHQIPLFKIAFQKNTELAESLTKELRLSKDEVEWLKRS